MTKTPISLQDLRRKIYVKAKAEPSWRFWGLYVHVCKLETLRAAYAMAKANDGAPGIDGVTFEAIEADGRGGFLAQLRDELVARTYRPLRSAARRRFRRTGARSPRCFRFRPSVTAWSRGRSSSSWSRSSKRTFNRGRLAIGRSGQRMRRSTRVAEAIVQGKTRVIDVDLAAYFDSVRHRSAARPRWRGGSAMTRCCTCSS